MTKFAFILSTGRTGTKFLAHYFQTNFETVYAVHEPKPSYLLRIISNAHAANRIPASLAEKTLRWSRLGRMRQAAQYDVYLESNPFLWGMAEIIPQVFENATIIHVVRDPREFVRSAINHGSTKGMKNLIANLIPFWSNEAQQRTIFMSQLDAIANLARHWCYINEKLSAVEEHGVNYKRIYFESLFDSHHTGLQQLCQVLELEYLAEDAKLSSAQKVNKSRQQNIGKWDTWTKEEQATLLQFCGPTMQEYGYS